MKTFRPTLLIASLAAVLAGSACVHTREQVDPDAQGAPRVIVERYPQAYEVLTPHGEWIYVHGVGHVWRPYSNVVGPDFYPYATGGRWAYGDMGWVFVSDWSWGHVPFHYGRWFYARGYGWVWLPGSVWAPSWVYWRYGGGYVGWAPMPPPGYYVGGYGSWCFVDRHRFGHSHVGRYREIDPAKARRAFHEATPVGGGRSGGPRPQWFADANTPPPMLDGKGNLKDAYSGGRYVGPPANDGWKGGTKESAPPPRPTEDWKAGPKESHDWGGSDSGGGTWDRGDDKGGLKGNNYQQRSQRPWETGEKGWRRNDEAKARTDWPTGSYVREKGPVAGRSSGERYRPPPAKAERSSRQAPAKANVREREPSRKSSGGAKGSR